MTKNQPYKGKSFVNTQPIEKRVTEEYGTVDVKDIFYTLQGEGPFTGRPAIFIRLAGCNLQCPMCDTDYTTNRYHISPGRLVSNVINLARENNIPAHWSRPLVVLTGGEPFRQQTGQLVTRLLDAGFTVQVETNGTLEPPNINPYSWSTNPNLMGHTGAYIVCSPKTGIINQAVLDRCCALKYVVDHENIDHSDGLPTKALGHRVKDRLARPPAWWDRPIYIQPADWKDGPLNDINLAVALDSSLKYGYTLQTQQHKMLGLD